jgi:hypothetical protein
MDPNHFGDRLGQQWKRISGPQIVGWGERQTADIVQRPDVVGVDSGIFQGLTVKRRSPAGGIYRPFQTMQLFFFQFFPGGK